MYTENSNSQMTQYRKGKSQQINKSVLESVKVIDRKFNEIQKNPQN